MTIREAQLFYQLKKSIVSNRQKKISSELYLLPLQDEKGKFLLCYNDKNYSERPFSISIVLITNKESLKEAAKEISEKYGFPKITYEVFLYFEELLLEEKTE